MALKLITTSLLFFLLAPLSILATPLSPSPGATCHKYVIISTRGTSEAQGPSIVFTSMINQTLSTVPGGIEYDTVYSAANDTPQLGADDIVRYIGTGLETCPSQSYVLLGYSQGAGATEIVLYNFTDPSSAVYKAIKAVLVVGNPEHKPNQAANFDQNGGRETYGATGVYYKMEVLGLTLRLYLMLGMRRVN